MFTRFVECTVQPEKKDQFVKALRNEVLPIFYKQPGFVDFLTIVPENESEKFISLSFWKTKEEAEKYHKAHYNEVLELLKPYLKIPTVKVEHYCLEISTPHKLAVSKAA